MTTDTLIREEIAEADTIVPSDVPPSTTMPTRDQAERPVPREIRGKTLIEYFDFWGAVAGGIALSSLLFGRFAPLQGVIGWVVITFICFVTLYALLVSLDSDRLEVKDKVMTVLMGTMGVLALGSLIFIVIYTVGRGMSALGHGNFFTHNMEKAGPLDPLTKGGIAHAIVGTLIQISIALSVTIPLGIGTAVFLNEVGGRFARFVRTVSDAMTALPSIVAGLFVYASFVQLISHERSGLAAALAIAVMMLPIIIRSADVVLRLVPGNLREASYALGASRWKTVWTVVLPTARSGLVTSVILGTARGIGETSPVLLTAGITAAMNTNPTHDPMISLPLQVFDFVKSPEPMMQARGFGTAAVLMTLVIVLFLVARAMGGRAPGELSPRQQRAAIARSRRDLDRIENSPATPVFTVQEQS